LDVREQYTPGWKFNEWELKGVPLRIEIGPRDVEKNQVILVRRDNFQKLNVEESNILNEAKKCLEEIQTRLFTMASDSLKANIHQAEDFDGLRTILDKDGGFVRACWCEQADCEDAIKNETGATIRTIPFQDEAVFAACVKCGAPAKKVAYFARSY
jgi:prolyl-tRNA synthetase